jgi:hypothetical protein
LVVESEVLNRPSPEPPAMAEAMAKALLAAGERIGRLPARVAVRDPEIAEALRSRLAASAAAATAGHRRPPAVHAGPLDELDEAAFALVEHTTGRPSRFLMSYPDTWAAWDLPEDVVARLFRLAAAYYRSAPWTAVTNLDVLVAVMPAGHTWTVCVLGNGGQELGISLYSEAIDLWTMVEEAVAETAFDDLEGRIVNLDFAAGGELPKPMRREVAAAGWEVAGAEAYPRIFAINTPAGGLRRRDVEDLAALLAAVPRFVAEHRAEVAAVEAVEDWRDEETGVVLSYRPPERGGDWPLEPIGEWLEPGCCRGPGAEPEAALTEARSAREGPDGFYRREAAVAERFARRLAEGEGLSRATVTKHSGNAETFVRFLAGSGVPVRAVHEYDLRVFLYDWYPRKGGDGDSRMATMPGSLERFFDFLADAEGIDCPWAREVLADRKDLRRRWEDAPLGPFWDTDVARWRAEHDEELYARLMLPDAGLGGEGREWAALMGPVEAGLHDELGRRWLLWRDALLGGGVDDWRELAVGLVARQRAWDTAPHPELDGKTPLQAIIEDRKRHGRSPGLEELAADPSRPRPG